MHDSSPSAVGAPKLCLAGQQVGNNVETLFRRRIRAHDSLEDAAGLPRWRAVPVQLKVAVLVEDARVRRGVRAGGAVEAVHGSPR